MLEQKSLFEGVEMLPPLEVISLRRQFVKDKCYYKVDLESGGMYKNALGKPHVMQVVKIAERTLVNDQSLPKDYISPFGFDFFPENAVRLLLGADCPARMENRVIAIQTLASSGALRITAEFLAGVLNKKTAYFSEQSWGHFLIFSKAGFTNIKDYRYWSSITLGLDFEGLKSDLTNIPEGSVVLLQNCGHNPTGCDPSRDQWTEIAEIVKTRRILAVFEAQFEDVVLLLSEINPAAILNETSCIIVGLCSGDYDTDAWPIRHFANEGIEFIVCQCFSKIFGLYSERVGTLMIIVNNIKKCHAIKSQLDFIVRSMYSNPPAHGARNINQQLRKKRLQFTMFPNDVNLHYFRIVSFILADQSLFEMWQDEVKHMHERLRNIRLLLREELEISGTTGKWNHIMEQKGIFTYTGLNSYQVDHMMKHHHIYMMNDGRINICGLTRDNIEYVARAINMTLSVLPSDNVLKDSYCDTLEIK